MSNPEGDLNTQTRRHRPAINGITVALLLALFAALIFSAWRWMHQTPPNPQDAASTNVEAIQGETPTGPTATAPATATTAAPAAGTSN